MQARFVLILLFLIEAAIADKLFRPTKKCVPTATVTGPCHVCVCHMDGLYHCQEKICQPEIGNLDPYLPECEPNELYREDTKFCSCSASGFWTSNNCRDQFRRLQLKKDSFKQHIRTNIVCKPNNFYIIDCNVCLCKANGAINFDSCTTRPCPKRYKGSYCIPGDVYRSVNELCICSVLNYYLDQFCLKIVGKPMQAVSSKNLAKIISFSKTYTNINENACKENVTFDKDCNTCTCFMNEFSCTNRICHDEKAALRKGVPKKSLFELKSLDEKCVPGRKYKLGCNKCLCNNNGEPICTSMICLQDLVVDSAALQKMIVSY